MASDDEHRLDPKLIKPGTFAAQQRLAHQVRDHYLTRSADGNPSPRLARLCFCVVDAVLHATHLVRLSRSGKPVPPSAFIWDFVLLEASIELLQATKDMPELLQGWPKDAGFIYGGQSGWNALDASMSFSMSIHGGVLAGRALHCIPTDGEPYASQRVVGDCGPDIQAWCVKAMERLRTNTCPASLVWPTAAELHAASQSIRHKLLYEYIRVVEAMQPPGAPQPNVMEIIQAVVGAKVRNPKFLEVTALLQADPNLTIRDLASKTGVSPSTAARWKNQSPGVKRHNAGAKPKQVHPGIPARKK